MSLKRNNLFKCTCIIRNVEGMQFNEVYEKCYAGQTERRKNKSKKCTLTYVPNKVALKVALYSCRRYFIFLIAGNLPFHCPKYRAKRMAFFKFDRLVVR